MTPPPGEDRRPPMTPQLALRVAVVGSFALAMFAIIFFRLWFLQVLSGDQYLAQARGNRTRQIAVVGPAGRDPGPQRRGPGQLDQGARGPDLAPRSSSRAPGAGAAFPSPGQGAGHEQPTQPLRGGWGGRRFGWRRSLSGQPAAGSAALRQRDHQGGQPVRPVLPGRAPVSVRGRPGGQRVRARRTRRGRSPHSCSAPSAGSPRRRSRQDAYRGISPNSIIGQSGLEGWYDRYLRGVQGSENVQVDALGRATGVISKSNPVAGHNLALSIDAKLQRVGQQALATSIASNPGATAGAFVAMNPGQRSGLRAWAPCPASTPPCSRERSRRRPTRASPIPMAAIRS